MKKFFPKTSLEKSNKSLEQKEILEAQRGEKVQGKIQNKEACEIYNDMVDFKDLSRNKTKHQRIRSHKVVSNSPTGNQHK